MPLLPPTHEIMNYSMIPKIPVTFLLSSLLLIASIASIPILANCDYYEQPNQPTFRSPKNILFGIFAGESSRHSWVGRIMHELSLRNHSVTYAGSVRYQRL